LGFKIKSIKKLGRKKACDINVPNYGCHFLANGVLTHNSGKTFAVRSLTTRMLNSGLSLAYVTDPKNEMWSNSLPANFTDDFAKGENTPENGFPTIALRPIFYKYSNGDHKKLPKGQKWWNISIFDLKEVDFKALLLGGGVVSNVQETIARMVYNAVQKLDKNKPITYEIMVELIKRLPTIQDSSRDSMLLKIEKLKMDGIFDRGEGVFTGSPAEYIRKGITPTLNNEGYDEYTKADDSLPQVYSCIFLRKCRDARRKDRNLKIKEKVNKIYMIIDEASDFAPKNNPTSLTSELCTSIKLDSAYGIGYVAMYQEYKDVPEEPKNQSVYILIAYNQNHDAFKKILEQVGIMGVTGKKLNDKINAIKKRMPKYSWLFIDRNSGRYAIIKSLSPLSHHITTSN